MHESLSRQHERAIELMLGGARDADVAQELGVNRSTVWRWRRDDPAFTAELNRQRSELWNANIERLRSLVPVALDVLAEELQSSRKLRAAAAVLDIAGFRARPKAGVVVEPGGPTTAEAVEEQRRQSAELQELLKPVVW